MKKAIVLFLSLISTAALASTRTFVSAANGDDLNPCSRPAPCRSFAAALVVTDQDGEVIVLDSGGYGPANITQSTSILSPAGIYAAITATSGNAITIAAGDTGRVALRNLALTSQGATNGIDANTVAMLSVEGCTISGFSTNGILFDPTTANAALSVSRCTLRRIASNGINVTGGDQNTGSNGATATIDSVHAYDCATGIFVIEATAAISNSVAAGGTDNGFFAYLGSKVTVTECVASNNGTGFTSAGGLMIVTRCEATSNNTGIGSHIFGAIAVSDSTIALNTTGVYVEVFAALSTRGNNTLQGNTTDGSFNQNYSAQ
jgi:hypothetical protein